MDKEEKKITVTVSSDNNKVIVKVMDNGSGIESDTLPYIFERFYRAEKSRNSSTGGSGLGLAIAKQIIEEHGGNIWAESELGEGTSIFFSLEKVEKCGE
jgi:signal transduction histidine kinase